MAQTLSNSEILIKNKEQFKNADNLFSPVSNIAELAPKNVALRFMGKNITYRQLKTNVLKYSEAFKKAGLVRGEAVTFALPNIPESVYILYGAAHCGLICSPLHPLSSPDSVATAMKKTGSRIIFSLGDCAEKIAELIAPAAVVAVNPAGALPVKGALYLIKNPLPKQKNNVYSLKTFLNSPQNTTLPAFTGCPVSDNTAVLLQSGGTTGLPKIIELSASSINALAVRGLEILGKDKVTDCGMLSVLPVFHGFGLAMGIHSMLCNGGKNVIFPKFHRASAVSEIKKGNVQFIIGVPRLYEALLSHKKFCGNALKNLYVAFVGGDFVPNSLMRKFDSYISSFGGSCRLFEGYGLTETVTVCSVNTVYDNHCKTVGKPLKDITITAFDFNGDTATPLPSGKEGELAVSGDTLMEGYLSDPAATDNVFFYHNGKKFVRTGDFGYVDNNGFVHFISRLKRIIKVKGIPVYPMEIEQLICEQDGITEACAVPVSINGEQKIALFCECDSSELCKDFKQFIKQKISEFAVPDYVIAVKKFPRTNVSKIDTNALINEHIK